MVTYLAPISATKCDNVCFSEFRRIDLAGPFIHRSIVDFVLYRSLESRELQLHYIFIVVHSDWSSLQSGLHIHCLRKHVGW